jgi:hypothetical protein
MADTGAPLNIPFVTPTDNPRVYPASSEDLADKVVEYLLFTETGPQTAAYTLELSDTSRVVAMNVSGAATVTVPTNASVAFPLGAVVGIYNMSSDLVTVQGDAGVTVRNAGDLDEYKEVSLRKRDENEWVMAGL